MEKADLPDLLDRLRQIGCTDLARAAKNLEALGQHHPLHRQAFARLLPTLLETLANIPDPDMALNNLERFFGEVIDRGFLLGLLRSSNQGSSVCPGKRRTSPENSPR
jgi:glutamine synthetase adenylyltransferase